MSRHGGSIHVTCYCMSTTQLFTSEVTVWIPIESMQRNTQHIWNVWLHMRSPPLDVLIIPAGYLNVDVLICSETSDPERFLLGEKNLMPLLKCFCLFLSCSLWKRRMFILYLSSFQAFLVFLSCGTSLLMDVWKHPSQHWNFWPVFHEHGSTCMQKGAREHAAPLCLIIPRMAGLRFEHSYPFSLRKTLSWVVAISTSCRWWRSVTASISQW